MWTHSPSSEQQLEEIAVEMQINLRKLHLLWDVNSAHPGPIKGGNIHFVT